MNGGRIVVLDQTVAPGMEVMHGPGVGRPCGYGPCQHRLHPDDPPTKRYHHPKCRTADWKARRASQTVEGSVAVQHGPGDAENGSQRARELRLQRKAGPVASDRRVQVGRAVQTVAAMLVGHGLVPSQEAADFYARIAVEDALPARFRA